MKPCPECCADVPDHAHVCPSCCSRIVGQTCAELSKEAAVKCRCCGHHFERGKNWLSADAFPIRETTKNHASVEKHEDEPVRKTVAIKAFVTKAALLPTVLTHWRLLPNEIRLSNEKIVIKSWGIMRLSHTDEDIPWGKVAGYRYHSGWFWDSIEIQTRGQSSNDIDCLPKAAGQRIKQTLERMKA